MSTLKVRKNFAFDKEVVDKASYILKQQHKSFTEVIGLYFQAIIKEPSILDIVEKSANKRKGDLKGAGLGFILMARKSHGTLKESFKNYQEGIEQFHLSLFV